MTAKQGCLDTFFWKFSQVRVLFYYHKGDIKILALFIHRDYKNNSNIIMRSYEIGKQSFLMSAYQTLNDISCDKGRPQVFFLHIR